MKTFSEAFRAHLDATQRSVMDISKAAQVSADAFYKLRAGKTQNMAVDDAVKVAAAFGETVEQFMGLTGPEAVDHLRTQLDLLTAQEREILQASITAVLASRATPVKTDAEDE